MTAQRYADPVAQERMAKGLCPECARLPNEHSMVAEFWVRFDPCSLLPRGVVERIAQYRADLAVTA